MTGDPQPDLSGIPMRRLLTRARGIKARRTKVMTESGRLIAELHRRGLSWRIIGKELDVPWATARNWALPYLDTEPPKDTAE